MRRQIAAIALASMLMLAGLGASAASASTMPAEGVFENCPIATQMVTCVQVWRRCTPGAQIRAADPSHPVMIGSADAYKRSANMIGAEIYPGTTPR